MFIFPSCFQNEIDSMHLFQAYVQMCLHSQTYCLLSSYIVTNHMSSYSGPEPSLPIPPWRIWAPSPVWSPTLMACPPASRSLKRVSQPIALASLLLCARNSIHLFVVVTSVLEGCLRPTGLCVTVSTAVSCVPQFLYECLSSAASCNIQCYHQFSRRIRSKLKS